MNDLLYQVFYAQSDISDYKYAQTDATLILHYVAVNLWKTSYRKNDAIFYISSVNQIK